MSSTPRILKVWSFCLIFYISVLGFDAISKSKGERGKSRRQVFREDVSPLLGGKVPSGAFDWSRLMFNNLDSRGISIPDGFILSNDRHPPEGVRSQERRIKLYSQDGTEFIDSTYTVRNPVQSGVKDFRNRKAYRDWFRGQGLTSEFKPSPADGSSWGPNNNDWRSNSEESPPDEDCDEQNSVSHVTYAPQHASSIFYRRLRPYPSGNQVPGASAFPLNYEGPHPKRTNFENSRSPGNGERGPESESGKNQNNPISTQDPPPPRGGRVLYQNPNHHEAGNYGNGYHGSRDFENSNPPLPYHHGVFYEPDYDSAEYGHIHTIEEFLNFGHGSGGDFDASNSPGEDDPNSLRIPIHGNPGPQQSEDGEEFEGQRNPNEETSGHNIYSSKIKQPQDNSDDGNRLGGNDKLSHSDPPPPLLLQSEENEDGGKGFVSKVPSTKFGEIDGGGPPLEGAGEFEDGSSQESPLIQDEPLFNGRNNGSTGGEEGGESLAEGSTRDQLIDDIISRMAATSTSTTTPRAPTPPLPFPTPNSILKVTLFSRPSSPSAPGPIPSSLDSLNSKKKKSKFKSIFEKLFEPFRP